MKRGSISPLLLVIFTIFLFLGNSFAGERRYDLVIKNISVNFTGTEVNHALGIAQTFPKSLSASIPAPTLRFQLGDEAVIKVFNDTDEPTTLHWHGVLVPWRQDGPQFTNTKIIEPKKEHTFRFPIKHTGTYWYHSHTEFQEQRGLYGAIVIEDEGKHHHVDHDLVYLMSDWIDMPPRDVLEILKTSPHYFAFKKKNIPNLAKIIKDKEFGNYIKSELVRMGAMDLGDVGYDAFLVNGKVHSQFEQVKPGDRVRLRIINAGASTYFYFNIGRKRHFKVISKDGMPVEPVIVNEIMIGMGETYDVIYQVPESLMGVEVRATAQDVSGHSSLVLGQNHHVETVPSRNKPTFYSTHHHHSSHHMEPDAHKTHDTHHHMPQVKNVETKLLDYTMLRSPTPSNFDDNLIRAQIIDLDLTGNMDTYSWSINGKPFSEDKYIDIRENEVITFRFINKTMMNHPLHLHGHFFRLLNGQGDHAPVFHTLDVGPSQMLSIEFHADAPGLWFLHCHNLYHMKMGMSRLVRYEGFAPPADLEGDRKNWGPSMTKDTNFFSKWTLGAYTNMATLELLSRNSRYELSGAFDFQYKDKEYELDLMLGRYFGRSLSVGPGLIAHDSKVHPVIGVKEILPLNLETSFFVGKDLTKLDLHKHITLATLKDRPIDLEANPHLFFQYENKEISWEMNSLLGYKITPDFKLGLNFRLDSHKKEGEHSHSHEESFRSYFGLGGQISIR